MTVEEAKIDNEAYASYVPERPYPEKGKRKVCNVDCYQALGPLCDNVCTSCKAYYKKLHKIGLKDNSSTPSCHGDSARLLGGIDPAAFGSGEEYNEARVLSDPVSWSYHELGFRARWYQQDVLSCTAQKKLYRMGRRMGKTAAMSIEALHACYTNANFAVLVVSPFLPQIENMFRMFKQHVDNSINLRKSVSRFVKNPNTLEFHNGSRITGYAVTPGKSEGADKIRGQDAHMIILDEASFIDPDHIQIVLAIMASYPEVRIIASSTPSPTKNHYFNWAFNKNLDYKEFWYIAAESPMWTEKTERQFASTTTQATYEREFDAIFTVSEKDVFRSDLIDAAIQDYSLDSMKPNPRIPTLMGVDWNKGAGAHIVILGWNGSKLFLASKHIINPEEYKQMAAVDAVIRLNDIWQPQSIFVDEGYGSVQVEMLHKHGIAYPHTGLRHKVVPVNMSSSIKVIDPLTQDEEAKPAKFFVVNNTVKVLEDGMLILPKAEDTTAVVDSKGFVDGTQVGIIQQMRGFKQERITPTGRPVYSQGYEHTLTALMLAVTGFMLRFTDLGRRASMSTIIMLPHQPVLVGDQDKTVEDMYADIDRDIAPSAENIPSIAENGLLPVNLSERGRAKYNDQQKQIRRRGQSAMRALRQKFNFSPGSLRKNF